MSSLPGLPMDFGSFGIYDGQLSGVIATMLANQVGSQKSDFITITQAMHDAHAAVFIKVDADQHGPISLRSYEVINGALTVQDDETTAFPAGSPYLAIRFDLTNQFIGRTLQFEMANAHNMGVMQLVLGTITGD